MDAPALLHLPKTVPHERLPTPTSCAEVSIVEPVIPTIGASRAQSSFAIIGNDLSLDQESLESARDGVRSREAGWIASRPPPCGLQERRDRVPRPSRILRRVLASPNPGGDMEVESPNGIGSSHFYF